MRSLPAWVIGTLALIVLLILAWGPLRLIDFISLWSQDDLEQILEELQDAHPWTPLIMVTLMVLEAMFAPLPAGPIVAANVLLFGMWNGVILSWLGALLGSLCCFWLARILGRGFVRRKVPEWQRQRIAEWTDRYGLIMIIGARMLPLANNAVSYLAGLTTMSIWVFLAASGIGVLPWILLYSLFARDLLQAQTYGGRLTVLVVFLVFIHIMAFYLYTRLRRPSSRKPTGPKGFGSPPPGRSA